MKTKTKTALVLVLLTGLMLVACLPVQTPTEIPLSGQVQQNPTDVPAQEQPAASGQAAPVTVTLTGMLWNDQCEAEPGTAPDPMPAGCIANAMGAAQANGIMDAGESPLAGVTVDLGAGACPSTGLASTVTDANGVFQFNALLPVDRTVCVSVDSGSDPNTDLLMEGIWTSPVDSNAGLAGWTVVIPDGQISSADLNFGWDYYAIGMSTAFIVGQTEANCRSGPGTLYSSRKVLWPDEEYPLIGKNADGTWFVLDVGDGMVCWVSNVVGSAQGNTDRVSVVSAPPLLLSTPTSVAAGSNDSAPIPACTTYTSIDTCQNAGCSWYKIAGRGEFCLP